MAELQKEFYQHMYDCASYAIIATDCQGMVISCNEAALQMFNTTNEHLLGHHVNKIMPDTKTRQQMEQALEQTITSDNISEFDFQYQPNTSSVELTLAAVIAPVISPASGKLGLAVWIRDITNRKILEQQLLQAEKMASLGTLASGVAHHFNNIIGGIATFVDYALKSNNPQICKRALKMTADATSRISHITASLLTFAEKESHWKTDLADLTETILTFSHLVEESLAEKNIKLELHLQTIPVIEVPARRIQQVLTNLLDNAEHALEPDGGTVSISLHPAKDNRVIIKFADNGCGIAKKDLAHIFDPFFTTRGISSGGDQSCSGLGLSVVHGIIRELGGNIHITSKPNHGTTFTISLPNKININ